MEKLSQFPLLTDVNFLKVAHIYVSNSKLECCYCIPIDMKISSSDWIGIFKVEAPFVRNFETFVWAVSPESKRAGLASQCSVQFQAYYLPQPGEQQYHFRYVDQQGNVRGSSEPFVFGEPQPLEELVTLEDEEACLDMLLVVPRATFLQNQLELAQRERSDLMRFRLDLVDKVSSKDLRIKQLETALEISEKSQTNLKQKYQDLTVQEQIARKNCKVLSIQESELREQNFQLEDDIQSLNKKILEKEQELEVMKASQSFSETKTGELEQRLADATVEIEHYQLQVESLKEKIRATQDMLCSSQQNVLLLREELATVSSVRDRTISDLHKSRVETSDLSIKFSDLSLKYKEEMAQWWQEKTALNHSMGAKRDQIVNLKAEKLNMESSLLEEKNQREALQCKLDKQVDASQVQLSECRRELNELKSALKVAQMEKNQLREERQEILYYARRLEERLDKVADEKWKEEILEEETKGCSGPSTSPMVLSDSEDESTRDNRMSQQVGSSLSEHELSSDLIVFSCDSQMVVINQPGPIACQLQPLPEDNPDT
ncbi:hypothetical protein GDO86_004447, partial [Hymenochirus boettgeri]